MTNATPEQTAAIQGLTALAEALYKALDNGNRQQILAAQQNLSAAAELVWSRAQGDTTISRQSKAVLRVLAGAALEDLPAEIQDPAHYPKIKKQLRLLKSSLVLLD